VSAFPLFCLIVLAAFLGCLALFALAVTKVVAPDGQGHSRGFLGGLAALIALFFFAGLGLFGLGAAVAAIGVGSAIDWNPIRRIEIQRSAPGWEGDPRLGIDGESVDEDEVRARITVRGGTGAELIELLHGMVDLDLSELEGALSIHHQKSPEGSEFDVYEFRLPLSERDLARFERELERELDGLKVHLPESVDIQFDGAE